MPAKKRSAAGRRGGAKRIPGGLACPDCDFVARHIMGLGRHRSARHGVIAKRAADRIRPVPPGGAWILREEAAERFSVHYNTVRFWERRGLVRTTKRKGIRGVFVHGDDVARAAGGAGLGAGRRGESLEDLEARYKELIANLERLLVAAKRSSDRVLTRRRGEESRPRAGARAARKMKARPGPGNRQRSLRSD